ncbi:2',5'-phosphodiesterase 12 [Cylas formicarius]|uniref:2',5'-phosphodiesterase 12 n=1 Tax=Cylas formicarius TaxID=197179 RepID=UPI0029584246|nr:2',5'-phosphodiesterase 12 [Cylas formicarius]
MFEKVNSLIKRNIHRYIYKMNKAYLRRINEIDQFQLSFEYSKELGNVKRSFNFSRSLSENVESLLNRISTNVSKKLYKKRNKKSETSSEIVETSLLVNSEEISSSSICKDVFVPENNIILSINGKSYQVLINSPWIESLSLPNSLLATFPVYPSKFETVFTDISLSQYVWSKSKDKIHWLEVACSYIYIPKNEDIDNYLKLSCTPVKNNFEGPAVEIVSNCKVEASPGHCPFERRHRFTKTRLQNKQFRVVTYNILADLYCDSDFSREVLFPYCPADALNIDYRKQLILKELIGYNADCICLQEVDRKVYKYDLHPILSHLGYKSNFHLKGDEVAEGLAFFYNEKRFKLLESESFIFSDHIDKNELFSDIWTRIETNSQLKQRILNRTTTLQINIIKSLEQNEILVVGNIHLYFHPDADHIRLLQGGLAIKYLEHTVLNLRKQYDKERVSLIFCGDFNSVPSCGIYMLYTTGSVPGNYIDYSSNKDEAIENIDMKHSLQLESACGTPKYTNFTAGFADCLDYIFIEKTNIGISQVIPLPSDEELTQHTAIPSIVCPSDHIALISDLEWL